MFGKVYGRFFLTPHLGIVDDETPDTSTLSELIETFGWWKDLVEQMPYTKTKKLYTMFETSDVHPSIVSAMKIFDQVVVPYQYLCDILLKHGVNCVAHGTYTSDLIRSGPKIVPKEKNLNKLIYLYVGTNDMRKNLTTLCRVFNKVASGTDHMLIVKTDRADNLPVSKNIKIITDKINYTKLTALYNMCDYVISFTRGEGVGLPMLEASYFGKPVVCHSHGVFVDTKKHVRTEWIDLPATEIPVDLTGVPSFLHEVFYGTWWDVNEEEAEKVLFTQMVIEHETVGHGRQDI